MSAASLTGVIVFHVFAIEYYEEAVQVKHDRQPVSASCVYVRFGRYRTVERKACVLYNRAVRSYPTSNVKTQQFLISPIGALQKMLDLVDGEVSCIYCSIPRGPCSYDGNLLTFRLP